MLYTCTTVISKGKPQSISDIVLATSREERYSDGSAKKAMEEGALMAVLRQGIHVDNPILKKTKKHWNRIART